jgi:hypothetical protein
MTASTKLRRFRAVGDLFARPGKRKQAANQTAQPELQPEDHLRLYLARDTARKAFSLLLANIRKENPHHHDRIVRDLETIQWSALTGYVVQMAFFESIRPPVRPLALPSRVADWLLALPDNSLGYHPEDLCWECGYAYPFSWAPDSADSGSAGPGSAPGSASPACRGSAWRDSACRDSACRDSACRGILPATFSIMHPFVGQHCLYCAGEIVNHLEWLMPNPKRTLSDFHSAPYRKKRDSMESHWRRELNDVQIPHQGRLPFLRP